MQNRAGSQKILLATAEDYNSKRIVLGLTVHQEHLTAMFSELSGRAYFECAPVFMPLYLLFFQLFLFVSFLFKPVVRISNQCLCSKALSVLCSKIWITYGWYDVTDVLALKKLANSWTDEFTRIEHEADFWEKMQKQWDELKGLVLFSLL